LEVRHLALPIDVMNMFAVQCWTLGGELGEVHHPSRCWAPAGHRGGWTIGVLSAGAITVPL